MSESIITRPNLGHTLTSDPNPANYRSSCQVIDCDHPAIIRLAKQIAATQTDKTAIARDSFLWVRDQIQHSSDYRRNPVTCVASEVLEHGTGYCYAKSHLLAALLRANQIPAGLCYQRLSLDGVSAPFCLHGLNAAYLDDIGWYRVDPRGNKDGVDAQFDPPIQKLAFTTDVDGERDLPGIYVRPLEHVVTALKRHRTWDEMAKNLPDEV